jgi:hypothetical protein
VDFDPGGNSPGERVNVDPMLVMSTLNAKIKRPGGVLAQKITGAATVGFVIVSLPNGSMKDIIKLATGDKKTWGVNIAGTAGTSKHVGWREMTP